MALQSSTIISHVTIRLTLTPRRSGRSDPTRFGPCEARGPRLSGRPRGARGPGPQKAPRGRTCGPERWGVVETTLRSLRPSRGHDE
eukprot:3516439-Pyramimonas_sp.AAC.1